MAWRNPCGFSSYSASFRSDPPSSLPSSWLHPEKPAETSIRSGPCPFTTAADTQSMRLAILTARRSTTHCHSAPPDHETTPASYTPDTPKLEPQVGGNVRVETAPDFNAARSIATEIFPLGMLAPNRGRRAPPPSPPFLSQNCHPPQRGALAVPLSHTIGAEVGRSPAPSRSCLCTGKRGFWIPPRNKLVSIKPAREREAFIDTNRENGHHFSQVFSPVLLQAQFPEAPTRVLET